MCTIKVTFFVSLCFNLNIKYKINYSYSYGMFWSRALSTTAHNIEISSRGPTIHHHRTQLSLTILRLYQIQSLHQFKTAGDSLGANG